MRMKKLIGLILTVMITTVLISCGSAPSGSGGSNSNAAAIELTAEPSFIEPGGFSIITAKVYNGDGELIEDNKTVNFSVDDSSLGSITLSSHTTNGEAKATFNSSGTSGTVNITAHIDGVTRTISIQIYNSESKAAVIDLVAEPSTIVAGGFAIIKATIYNSTGELIEDNRIVNFYVDNSLLGSITASSLTKNGVASATFRSSNNSGTVNIAAKIDDISKSIKVYINKSGASSIEFSSAEPQVIGLKGSGQTEVAEIKFLVKDFNGQPIADNTLINLKLNGPNGNEYIGDVPGIKEMSVYTVNGYASIFLHSGNIPGTATVLATIDGTNLNTSSGVISIGGGFPSAKHLSISSSKLNLAGLAYDNIQADINVLLGDRYGNYNVLGGTTVSFYSECGAIDRSVVLSDNGSGTVKFRTQSPQPQDVEECEDTTNDYCKAEQDFIDLYWRTMGVNLKGSEHLPRDGLCTIVAVVDGEEEFVDANGNGLYDEGETFVDLTDIILDKNDDKTLNSSFEHLIVDKNNNGEFDLGNGKWDNNTRISKEFNLLITGVPTIKFSKSNIALPYGGSTTIYYNVSDINYNRPSIKHTPYGNVANVQAVKSGDCTLILSGDNMVEFNDSNIVGSSIYKLTVINNNPLHSSQTCEIEFTLRWGDVKDVYTIPVYLGPKPPDNATSPNP